MSKKVKTNKKGKNIFNTIAILGLASVLIVSMFGFVVLDKILEESKSFNEGLLNKDEPTTIMVLKDGEYVVGRQLSTGDGIRENTTYDQLPQVVIDAFLAVEDSRYFKHNGFDLPRFLKALLENIMAGSFAQGGSTLTMQMIDVSHVTTTSDQNAIQKLIAKVQEIFMAMDAENYLSKEDILMNYLNLINFGGPARGIEKGAQYYFGKSISEVNLSEAAFLAGVINAPNAYNPYSNYKNAVARRDNALYLMKLHGYISEEEYNLAINTELAFQLGGTSTFDGTPLQSLVDYIDWYCDENLGIDIYEGNMTIYTTFDLEAQELYDSIMNNEYKHFDGFKEGIQSGSALINVDDGSIAALAGGLNYSGDNRKNFAYKEEHQTGSSIKPLLDYTLAFEYLGWATDQIIPDIPTYYAGTKLQVFNQDKKHRGDVGLQDAVAYSWNIPAITALQEVVNTVGAKQVVKTMASLGLSVFEDIVNTGKYGNFKIGMAIGGADMFATPLEMAAAYACLANGGVYTEPYAITKIEFRDGSREDYVHEVVTRRVFSAQASYLMNETLVNAVSKYNGLFQSVMKSGYQVATKTGTSDWADDGKKWGVPTGSAKDKWTISYTSKYAIATWLGYDIKDPATGQPYSYLTNAQMNKNVPTYINKRVFDFVHKNNRPSNFKQPSGIVEISHIKGAFDNGHFALTPETPEELKSTGKVLSKYANLKTLKPDEIQALNNFTSLVNPATKSIDFTFTPYPDEEAVKEFEGKYNGVTDFPEFDGVKIFDKKVIYGPIVYKVEVKQLGITVGTFTFSEATGSISNLLVVPGVEAQVIGCYGYKNVNTNSNTINITLSGEDTMKLVDIPILPDPGPETPETPETPVTPENPDDPTNE